MADQKITQLTEDTSIDFADLLASVEDPAGTPVTKKITFATLQRLFGQAWIPAADTWTYASDSTFTIAGVDRTSIFTKGTRLKFTQTTDKYAVVVSSSFSTNTTVTIPVNTDYTIANAAITSPYYSYAANPQGYPNYFAYSPTLANLTLDNGTVVARFSMVGGLITGRFLFFLGSGSAVGSGPTFTLPVSAHSTFGTYEANRIGGATLFDDSVGGFLHGHVWMNTSQTVATIAAIDTTTTYASNANITSTVPFTWATNDIISVNFAYEAA